eukprot:992397-Amphidinium_carterae.1
MAASFNGEGRSWSECVAQASETISTTEKLISSKGRRETLLKLLAQLHGTLQGYKVSHLARLVSSSWNGLED